VHHLITYPELLENMKRITLTEAWQGTADCATCTLRNSALFQGLDESDFAQVHEPIDQFVVKPGDQIYGAGDSGEHMFTIRTGLVKLVQTLPDGRQRIVRLLQSTDVLGLETILSQRYQHDAVALQETEICRYPARAIKNLSRTNPALHQSLMEQWQRALNDADIWLTELSTGSARQRVARLLIHLVKDQPAAECLLFNREDLGSMLAITTETASRTIAEFKRQSLIVESDPNRFICDLPNLERIAAG